MNRKHFQTSTKSLRSLVPNNLSTSNNPKFALAAIDDVRTIHVNANKLKNSAVANAEKFVQKSVRVGILGATTQTGQALALLLKQSPLFSHIYLYDRGTTSGIAADLKYLDTRCNVTGVPYGEINEAVKNADIIVMLGPDKVPNYKHFKDLIKVESDAIISMATSCAMMAPKAILVDCIYPVSMTLPVISEIYRRNHWYHPGRVIGSVAMLQIRLNTLLALHQNLDPASVHVPLLGGPDDDIILPLFSRATPAALPLTDAQILINRFRCLDDDAEHYLRPKNKPIFSPNSAAFAINRLVTTIAMGLMGDTSAIATAHVRSNFISSCKHITSTVKFGSTGVVHNYGVPRLTKQELKFFERSCRELEKREQYACLHLEEKYADEDGSAKKSKCSRQKFQDSC